MRVRILLTDEAREHPVQRGRSAMSGCNDLARLLRQGGCEMDERLVGRDGTLTRLRADAPAADAGEDGREPDLVINVVSDADLCPRALDRIDEMLPGISVPVLNRPEAVRRARRSVLPTLTEGEPGLVCPPTARLACTDPAAFAAEAEALVGLPLLARPTGSHSGLYMRLCAERDELARHAATMPAGTEWYVTRFVDTRGPDGLYRKVRVFVAGDAVTPRHLLATEDWNVTMAARDGLMKRRAALRDEERRFVEVFDEAVWPAPARAAVAALKRATGLDYFGVEGALLPDGRLLLFEATASMNVLPMATHERYAYHAGVVARLQAAAVAMAVRAAGGAAGPDRDAAPS